MDEPIRVLELKHNVKITKRNTITNREHIVSIHNIATKSMISGIISFLRGEFNLSNTQISTISVDSARASNFIPTYVGFGNAGRNHFTDRGIDINDLDNEVLTDEQKNALIDYKNLYGAYYDNTRLYNELEQKLDDGTKKLLRVPINRSSVGQYSTFYSDSLLLSTYVEKGYYVGKVFIPKSGTNEEVPGNKNADVIITEVGLFSGPNDDDTMLARVCLDPKDWIVQTSQDVITINWTITVTAVTD